MAERTHKQQRHFDCTSKMQPARSLNFLHHSYRQGEFEYTIQHGTNSKNNKFEPRFAPRLRHWSGACTWSLGNGSARTEAGYRSGCRWRMPWPSGAARRARSESPCGRTRKSKLATPASSSTWCRHWAPTRMRNPPSRPNWRAPLLLRLRPSAAAPKTASPCAIFSVVLVFWQFSRTFWELIIFRESFFKCACTLFYVVSVCVMKWNERKAASLCFFFFISGGKRQF